MQKIRLTISNGFCSDTTAAIFTLENRLEADFTFRAKECVPDPVAFISIVKGQIVKHQWSFGDGAFSNQVSPLHTYRQAGQVSTVYQVSYSVTDKFGCTKSIIKPVAIHGNCAVYIPNAFTPGNDGRNDFFKPISVKPVEDFEFRIFNRWGQNLFFTKDLGQGWDGRYNGLPQGAGVYIWMMRYRDGDTKKIIADEGSFVLVR